MKFLQKHIKIWKFFKNLINKQRFHYDVLRQKIGNYDRNIDFATGYIHGMEGFEFNEKRPFMYAKT